MKGRRAVSEDDIKSIMLGLFNPDNVPEFSKNSGVVKAVEQINRETDSDYKVKDFVDKKELSAIRKKYKNIPLGLSEDERQRFFRTTFEEKKEDRRDLIEQRNEQRSELPGPKPQIPLPNVPMPNVLPVTASVNPTTNLTRTETALLSPEEQVIAQRGRGGGIMDLV
jgi:hypothetical protein